MAPAPATPRRPAGTRVRTRPKSAAGLGSDKNTPTNISSEPPPKKRKYIPGGPGGGGRYVDEDGNEIPVGGTGPGGYNYIGPRGRIGRENLAAGVIPPVYKRRDRDRTQRATPRTVQPRITPQVMRSSTAAQAAAVVQSDSYKPREERAWEEFHPDLDIDVPLFAFSANEVEGILESRPVTPTAQQSADALVNGLHTPNNGAEASNAKSEGFLTPSGSVNGESSLLHMPGTPGSGRRRPGRPPKNPTEFYARRAATEVGKVLTPRIPKVLAPISNINAKEKLTLPQPSYRKTDTLARFDDKSLDFVRYVDKSMAKVGYQESDNYERPEYTRIKGADVNLEEDLDLGPGNKSDGEGITALGTSSVGRVEYDMDEQDDKWLEAYNKERAVAGFEPITREIFEITITKIEKEWHALEKRIPKPNPKPPQTHRPRSSSAAAVNGEGQGEEQDSKCAICDDGDCENTNAIVFCDGCDLAVHQECYGVPFIPEGQWLCRKCQLIGRGVPTCIFCPNTDGAFKQTNSSKWAHLLCAMWIPEVTLGNTTFMEPVMDVEKVPKTRWKLNCYLCNQRMGACIQCSNKACYQAFHVTCARRARLFLRMKNNQGTLAVIDGSTVMKAYCDKHCPPDHKKENDVENATDEAKRFFRKTMRRRLWADSQASAVEMAQTHRHAVTEHQPNESQLTGKIAGADKKSNQQQKTIWRLPSGAPVIPKSVFEIVEKSLHRFTIHKRKEYAANACQYWTLKREARRGAALLKRLQLQMETFSSMEITRRNFAGMGHSGRFKLDRRIEFAKILVEQLQQIKSLSKDIVERERMKLEAARLEEDVTDTVYFPVAKFFPPIVERALGRDSHTFTSGLMELYTRVKFRQYTTASSFTHDFCKVFRNAMRSEAHSSSENGSSKDDRSASAKKIKAHAKRILKAAQPQLEEAIRAEAEVCGKVPEDDLKDLARLMDLDLQIEPAPVILGEADDDEASHGQDIEMPDASPSKANGSSRDIEMLEVDALGEEIDESDTIVAKPSAPLEAEETINTDIREEEIQGKGKGKQVNGTKSAPTPPSEMNGYASAHEDAPDPQPSPPTPPISNKDIGNDRSDTLTKAGIPWYLTQFEPEGTSLVQPREPTTPFHDDLSDVEGLVEADAEGEVALPVITASVTKAKKGKAKKTPRRKK